MVSPRSARAFPHALAWVRENGGPEPPRAFTQASKRFKSCAYVQRVDGSMPRPARSASQTSSNSFSLALRFGHLAALVTYGLLALACRGCSSRACS